MHDYIVTVLNGMGITEESNGFSAITSVVELCACRPELGLSEIIAGYAQANRISRQFIEKSIEKNFNVYDADRLKRISKYTGTSPITHKDALYDVAVTVSVEYTAMLQKR